MNKTILFGLLFAVLGLTACEKEEDLTLSEHSEFGYAVPQGEHDYDPKIVDWYNRCNFFILYRFLPRDIYWSVTGWTEAYEREDQTASAWSDGWKADVADEAYVGSQLKLLEEQLLRFYPDSVLRRCMPLKILLCSRLYYVSNDGSYKQRNVYSGFDHLALNWGSAAIEGITSDSVRLFKNEVNLEFLLRLKKNNKIPDLYAFYEVSDYSEKSTSENRYEKGFLKTAEKQEDDWARYLEAVISTTLEDLTTETSATDATFKGILNAVKDTKGLIRKKYDIIVGYYKDKHGIDLQAIGNSVVK